MPKKPTEPKKPKNLLQRRQRRDRRRRQVERNLDAAASRGTDNPGNNDAILDVGEVWIYTGVHTVTQADIDAGDITNTAEVDGDTALGVVEHTSNTVVLEICQDAEIAL